MARFNSIEALRAVAALLVVMFHVQTITLQKVGALPFFGIFSGGNHGVDLFFVLSGFIIVYVHKGDFGRPGRIMNYVFNRIARIYPAVWIMSCCAIALYISGYGGGDKLSKLSFGNILSGFLLLPQFKDALVNVTWTLKYEIFYYIIMGIIVVNVNTGAFVLIFWQLAALIFFVFFSIFKVGILGFYCSSLSFEFLIGMIAATILFMLPPVGILRVAGIQWSLFFLGIFVFLIGMKYGNDGAGRSITGGAIATHEWNINFLCALGAALLIISVIVLEQDERFHVPKFMKILGNASYSIYITHYSVVSLLLSIFAMMKFPINNLTLLLFAVSAIACGVLFHNFIDQPIQKVLRVHVKPKIIQLGNAKLIKAKT